MFMRNWRAIIIVLCLLLSVILIGRDLWISPSKEAFSRDMPYVAGIALGGILLWLGNKSQFFKSVGALAGTVGAGLIGIQSWFRGREIAAFLYLALSVLFLSFLISLIWRRTRTRKSDFKDASGAGGPA